MWSIDWCLFYYPLIYITNVNKSPWFYVLQLNGNSLCGSFCLWFIYDQWMLKKNMSYEWKMFGDEARLVLSLDFAHIHSHIKSTNLFLIIKYFVLELLVKTENANGNWCVGIIRLSFQSQTTKSIAFACIGFGRFTSVWQYNCRTIHRFYGKDTCVYWAFSQ